MQIAFVASVVPEAILIQVGLQILRRTYSTRHGDGPFNEEAIELKNYSSFTSLLEAHNKDDGPQGKFRTGPFNMLAIRYAILACGGADGIALNHLDLLPNWDIAHFEKETGVKVVMEGRGPAADDRMWRTRKF